jgi:hypothetical protein
MIYEDYARNEVIENKEWRGRKGKEIKRKIDMSWRIISGNGKFRAKKLLIS